MRAVRFPAGDRPGDKLSSSRNGGPKNWNGSPKNWKGGPKNRKSGPKNLL